MAVSAHHDKVSLSPFGFGDQLVSDIGAAPFHAMKGRVDPMMTEMIDRIDAHDCLLLRWMLAGHDHDRHLLGLVQKWHGLSQRPSGFAGAVPGDEDTIE